MGLGKAVKGKGSDLVQTTRESMREPRMSADKTWRLEWPWKHHALDPKLPTLTITKVQKHSLTNLDNQTYSVDTVALEALTALIFFFKATLGPSAAVLYSFPKTLIVHCIWTTVDADPVHTERVFRICKTL